MCFHCHVCNLCPILSKTELGCIHHVVKMQQKSSKQFERQRVLKVHCRSENMSEHKGTRLRLRLMGRKHVNNSMGHGSAGY